MARTIECRLEPWRVLNWETFDERDFASKWHFIALAGEDDYIDEDKLYHALANKETIQQRSHTVKQTETWKEDDVKIKWNDKELLFYKNIDWEWAPNSPIKNLLPHLLVWRVTLKETLKTYETLKQKTENTVLEKQYEIIEDPQKRSEAMRNADGYKNLRSRIDEILNTYVRL